MACEGKRLWPHSHRVFEGLALPGVGPLAFQGLRSAAVALLMVATTRQGGCSRNGPCRPGGTVKSTLPWIVRRRTCPGRWAFGTFAARDREARTGRNPQSGERVVVAAKRTVHFKPSKAMRARLNLAKIKPEDEVARLLAR